MLQGLLRVRAALFALQAHPAISCSSTAAAEQLTPCVAFRHLQKGVLTQAIHVWAFNLYFKEVKTHMETIKVMLCPLVSSQ
jgi:hypothetical protein